VAGGAHRLGGPFLLGKIWRGGILKTIHQIFFEVHAKKFQQYEMVIEALRRHEGFRKDTDEAFERFWNSIKNLKIPQDHNISTNMSYEECYDNPFLEPSILKDYCDSKEAVEISRKYSLPTPFHYNQDNNSILIPLLFPRESRIYLNDQAIWKVDSQCLSAVAHFHEDILKVTRSL
jgi:hypothetical protein